MCTAESSIEISRILSAHSSCEVFLFTRSQIVSSSVTLKDLTAKYKNLARLVHPDKCQVEGSVEAFKRLRNAFEDVEKDFLDAGPAGFKTGFGFRKNAEAKPSDEVATRPAGRKSTVKEFMAKWNAEEAKFMDQQQRRKTLKRKRPDGSDSNKDAERSKYVEEAIEGVQERQNRWKTFSHGCIKSGLCATEIATNSISGIDKSSMDGQSHEFCCLLCSRSFISAQKLLAHEMRSALHASNLSKAAL